MKYQLLSQANYAATITSLMNSGLDISEHKQTFFF